MSALLTMESRCTLKCTNTSDMDEILLELNEAQRDAAACIEGPVMIIAGAGSGKTRTLTYRIAHLINEGVDPFRILALTFTNKAAAEMRERIKQLVGPEARNIWMGTFHSIFARILRSEATKLGYTSSFTIYDTDDSKSAIRQIIKNLNLDNKVYAHTKTACYICPMSIAALAAFLPRSFCRASKSTIINVMKIRSISRSPTGVGEVAFNGTEKKAFISRNYYKVVREIIEETRLK